MLTNRLEHLDSLFKANFTIEKCQPHLLNFTESLDLWLYNLINRNEITKQSDTILEKVLNKV